MTPSVRGLLLGIAAALLAQGPAQAQPAAPASSAAELSAARRLAELANPTDMLLKLNIQGWEAGARSSFRLDPAAAKLERSYPGVVDAFVAATRPLAERQSVKFVRQAHEVKAEAFAKGMSLAEISQVSAFLETALGQRVVRGILANANITGVIDDLAARKAESPDAQITAGSIRSAEHKAIRKASEQFSAAEHVALMRFSSTPAAKKYVVANQQAEQTILKMVNNPDPDWLAQQAETGRAAILAFVERKERAAKASD